MGKSSSGSAVNSQRLLTAARRAAIFLFGTYLAWILLFPSASGTLGRDIGQRLVSVLGYSAYVLPVVFYYGLFLSTRTSPKGVAVYSLVAALGLAALSLLFAHVGRWAALPVLGGVLGRFQAHHLSLLMGTAGSILVGAAVLLFSVQALFDIPWASLFQKLLEAAKKDYKEWQEARQTLDLRKEAEQAAAPIRKAETKEPVAVPMGEHASDPRPLREAKRKAEAEKPVAPRTPRASGPWRLPGTDILELPVQGVQLTEDDLSSAMKRLEQTLANFGISVKATGANPGPVITQYELTPAPGVKVSSIEARASDIALTMKAQTVRIEAPIPGKAAVGIEIPNPKPAKVVLREILESNAFKNRKGPLPFCLGKNTNGTPQVAEISSMPHLLVAGATNSGKSVLIHAIILSLLYQFRPDELKLLLIDPKRLELTFYEGIPHLYDPRIPAHEVQVLTQPKEASKSLYALLAVMSDRYEKYKTWQVRNIEGFNQKAAEEGMPRDYYIVVVIDELADLILVAQKSIEDSIQRLAQMARAVGIHLVLATQRPSIDVITGVIKANLPARIALSVISQIDSRVILDVPGAENLLGRGDMLYLASGAPNPVRLQAPYVSEAEINRVTGFWKSQGKPSYEVIVKHGIEAGEEGKDAARDKDLSQALLLVMERRRVSQDLLKAHFGSSARATDILSLLEVQGFIHKPDGTNRWEIFYDKIEDYLKQKTP